MATASTAVIPSQPRNYEQFPDLQPTVIELGNTVRGIVFINGKFFAVMPKKNSIDVIENSEVVTSLTFDNDKLKVPNGICKMVNKTFAVSDTDNTRIIKHNDQGVILNKFGSPGDGECEFDIVHVVYDIAFCKNNSRLYAVDCWNDPLKDRIKVLDSNLNFVKHFGVGILSKPYGIAISKNGDQVYVTERDSCKLREFTDEGDLVNTVVVQDLNGDEEIGWGILGVAVDENGFILVCVNEPKSYIQVFNPDLSPHASFGEGVLKNPWNICILPDERIAVADDKRIVIF